MTIRRYLVALAATASSLALASGCGDSSDHAGMDMDADRATNSTTTAPEQLPDGVNRADVSFTRGMIPHHQQAVEMAKHVIANGDSDEVAALARRVEAAQGPEIDVMAGWLERWGLDAPVTDGAHSMDDMADGSAMDDTAMDDMAEGTAMDGMVSGDDMQTFLAATGAELDTMFLELMIEHHEGAIAMAESQITDGSDADVIDLATGVATSQQAEIEEMRALLDALSSS